MITINKRNRSPLDLMFILKAVFKTFRQVKYKLSKIAVELVITIMVKTNNLSLILIPKEDFTT